MLVDRDARHRSLVALLDVERLGEQLAPDDHGSVLGPGRELEFVREDCDGGDRRGVAFELLQTLARLQSPHDDRVVTRPREDLVLFEIFDDANRP